MISSGFFSKLPVLETSHDEKKGEYKNNIHWLTYILYLMYGLRCIGMYD